VLRRGLSPLATTISTKDAAPVVAGSASGRQGRLWKGRGVDGDRGDRHRPRPGASGEILVRGDSAYGTSAVVAACLKAEVRFSLVLTKPAVNAAIATNRRHSWTPVHYRARSSTPNRRLISDAEVAEVTFTAFASTQHPATARLVVRRSATAPNSTNCSGLRYHPFLTNSDESTSRPSRPTSPTAGTQSSKPCSPT